MLSEKVSYILQQRGIKAWSQSDLQVRDVGAGPFIDVWNAATLGARPTDAELAAIPDATATTAARTARFQMTADNKDNLATIALIVRARGIPAWNALTLPQKVAAVRAEADVWRNIRDFIEDNL